MPITDFQAVALDGRPAPLSEHAGEVLLVVNVASRCGLTPQYAGLEALQQQFHAKGFNVLGFPCNQFGGQEPGAADEIGAFCRSTYGVSFPMYAKIEVNGPAADPLYKWLKGEKKGLLGTEAIKWNFTKFLIGRDGEVIERFAPTTEPAAIAMAIQKALA
jgi:glutathione peroxidase